LLKGGEVKYYEVLSIMAAKKLKTDNSSVIIQQENERITNKVF
jgi:hypothetical protein